MITYIKNRNIKTKKTIVVNPPKKQSENNLKTKQISFEKRILILKRNREKLGRQNEENKKI